MTNYRFVKIQNNCVEAIRVNFRFRRTMKGDISSRKTSITLKPSEESVPLPFSLIVGAKGWNILKNRDCINIIDLPSSPRFFQITNKSKEKIDIPISPATEKRKQARKTISIEPNEKSSYIDIESIIKRDELKRMESNNKISVKPIFEIGPSTGKGRAIASFMGESVYICYECGGPIIFRGSPPHPVHL